MGQASGPLHAQYLLDGNAADLGGDCFELTSALAWQNGSIWHPDLIDLRKDFAVSARLNFGTLDSDGADGIAFLLQPISTALGSAGGGIGYQGVSPSLGVEFDTYQNFPVLDPSGDHVAIQSNGDLDHGGPNNLDGPASIRPTSPNVEDGNDYPVLIRWNAADQDLDVFVDCNLRVSYSGDMVSDIFGGNPFVYIGFTASTGGMVNQHQVCMDRLDVALPPTAYNTCLGDSVQLSAPDGFSGYSWSPASAFSEPSSPNPWVSPSANSTYTVQYEDPCGNTWVDTAVVVVETGPAVDLGPDSIICAGASIVLSDPAAPGSLLWSDGSTSSSITVGPGVHWLQASIGGCPGFDTVLVQSLREAIDLGEDLALCPGDSAELVLPSISGATVVWSNGSSANSLWTQAPNVLSVDVDRGGCMAQDTVFASLAPLPEVSLPDSIFVCRNAVFNLSASGTASAWTWSSGAAGMQLISLYLEGNEVLWVEGDLDGCTARDTTYIAEPETCSCQPIAPNAFSPNRDGINERFRLLNTRSCPRPDRFALRVFTRWGELVFQSTEWGTAWDGTFQGRTVEAGAYVWTAVWQYPGQDPVEMAGSVTVIH